MVYFRTTAVSDCSAAKKNGRRSKERKKYPFRWKKKEQEVNEGNKKEEEENL